MFLFIYSTRYEELTYTYQAVSFFFLFFIFLVYPKLKLKDLK